MIRKYVKWTIKPINVPYIVLYNLVGFAVIGVLTEIKWLLRWFKQEYLSTRSPNYRAPLFFAKVTNSIMKITQKLYLGGFYNAKLYYQLSHG